MNVRVKPGVTNVPVKTQLMFPSTCDHRFLALFPSMNKFGVQLYVKAGCVCAFVECCLVIIFFIILVGELVYAVDRLGPVLPHASWVRLWYHSTLTV